MKKTNKIEQNTETGCSDIRCPYHGKLRIHGRTFKGKVKKVIGNRAVIEFERLMFVKKYERYLKKFTRLHCYVPKCVKINVGDFVSVGECKSIGKIINFVVLKK